MEPRLWFATLPPLAKSYLLLSLAVQAVLRFPPLASYVAESSLWLDWFLIVDRGQLWRLASNFLLWSPGVLMSAYQIGLLAHYFRVSELEHSSSHRRAFDFALQLAAGCALTLGFSYTLWPDLGFGGPVLLLYVITLYSRRSPDAEATFFVTTFARKWLPLAHCFVLYVLQTNWVQAALGVALGFATAVTLQVFDERTGIRVPEALYRFGEKLQLGSVSKAWQVNRAAGSRLGGD